MAYTNDQTKIHLLNKDQASTLEKKGDKLGTYYLADNPKHYEIQRQNNFVFYVEGLNKKLNIPQNKYAQDNAEDVIKLSVASGFTPFFTISPITLKRGNNAMKFAGNPEFGSGTLTVNDFIGAGSKDIFYAWQQKAYNVETEKVGLQSDYKKDAYLIEYTPDYQIVRTWKLLGCWCSGLSGSDYNHDSAEKQNFNATIEYDKAYIDTSDV